MCLALPIRERAHPRNDCSLYEPRQSRTTGGVNPIRLTPKPVAEEPAKQAVSDDYTDGCNDDLPTRTDFGHADYDVNAGCSWPPDESDFPRDA